MSASPSAARGAGSFGSFRSVEGFYIAGGALAAWALILTAIGVTRENFPSTRGATRLVAPGDTFTARFELRLTGPGSSA